MNKTVWNKMNEEQKAKLFAFNEEYRKFLSASKTERIFAENCIKEAKEKGFRPLDSFTQLKAGDKVYVSNRGKSVCLFVIGKQPVRNGLNILGAHIDSPRMDLKQHPLYEKDGIALFDTHYYGGIKKYQWVAIPMALAGVVCKKDGTVIQIRIGDNPGDPVVGVSDLLVHLASVQMAKNAGTVVEGEALDLTVGSIPDDSEKDPVKSYILNLLKNEYGIEEDDFISAEIEAVPAGEARDYGLDRSMIMGYGHDDKVCAYTNMRAILDIGTPARTACVLLVDKEEIGSVGSTSMESRFFEYTLAEVLAKQGDESQLSLFRCLSNSRMLSGDVTAAYDPLYPEVMDTRNAAYFGKGIAFAKFTGRRGKGGSNDANAEFIAKVRRVMDDNDVMFQTCELGAVDAGGGGTIAYILANLNMDVIDAGIPVQNMHAPYEVVSKADVYESYRAYCAFLTDMD